jgi:hypothetical protein
MATTTNYSWETPDDTDLVKDGAAAIRTLGSSIDTTTKALNPSTTLGDIEYRSATANTNTRLGIGSTGNVLTVAGGVPTWAAPAGGGKVLQVVHATTTTVVSSATNTFVDTTLTATITPSSATSKVLVLISQNGLYKNQLDAANCLAIQLLRGATVIASLGTEINYQNSAERHNSSGASLNWLDSPATTSATTYKTQFKSQNNAATVEVQAAAGGTTCNSTIVLMEIGA